MAHLLQLNIPLANSAEGNTEWDYNTIAKHSCIAADALVEQMNIK
jgi:hypothetical protein